MRSWKRSCSAALAGLVLLMAGCSAPSSQQAASGGAQGAPGDGAKGRFVETEVTPEGAQDGFTLVKGPNGGLTLMDAHAETALRWDSADGGDTWRKSEMPWVNAPELAGGLRNVIILEDGSLVVESQDTKLYHVGADNTLAPIPLPELEGFAEPAEFGEDKIHCQINNLLALPGGNFYMSYGAYIMTQSGAYTGLEEPAGGGIYQPDGTCVRQLGAPGYSQMGVGAGCLYQVQENGALVAYDAQTGETVPAKSGQLENPESFADITGFDCDDEGNLYFFSTKAVKRFVPGGNLTETILDGEMYTFGSPLALMNGTAVLAGPRLFIEAQDSDGAMRLYRYDYDPEAPIGAASTLRVWALEDSDALRQAVSLFRRSHPETKVQLELALDASSGAGVTAEDAVRTLNTQLMAGSGPDVLILDGTPAESFAANGLLADLSPYVDTSALYDCFTQPFARDGRYPMLPALCHFAILAGDQERIEGFQSVADIASAVAGGAEMWDTENTSYYTDGIEESRRPAFYFESVDSLFDILWGVSAPAIFTGGDVDGEELDAFLSACKIISDKCRLAQRGEKMFNMGFGTNQVFYDVPNEVTCYMFDSAFNCAAWVDNISLLAYPLSFHGPEGRSVNEDARLTLLPGPAAGTYRPVLLAGISANGTQQELSGAFVGTLLGEDLQSTELPTGIPTTKAGVAAQVKQEGQKYAELVEEGMMPEGAGQYPVDVEALIGRLSTPLLLPDTVTEAVRAQVTALCKGETDQAKAAAAIADTMRLYLAEQA